MDIKVLYSKDWQDYELLDTGEGEKLERFGGYTFVRPYEDAVWPKTISKKEWESVSGKFWSSKKGAKPGWTLNKDVPKEWVMSYKDLRFRASPTPFRHLSFFPEQASHWNLIETQIKNALAKDGPWGNSIKDRPLRFLNLFGYTGVASLAALRAGAEVTHLDASAQSLKLAKENQKLSGMKEFPMRIIEDDALKFLEREAKRGNKYDAVIMDPPKFGRGPKGEVWKLEESLPILLEKVKNVLSDKPLFVILTSYAVDVSSLSLTHALQDTMKDFGGQVQAGELCVIEKSNNRAIPLANTAVWENS